MRAILVLCLMCAGCGTITTKASIVEVGSEYPMCTTDMECQMLCDDNEPQCDGGPQQ